MLKLRELSRADQELSAALTAETNRLREHVHRYYSPLLELCPTVDEPWLWQLLAKAPRPSDGRALRVNWLQRLLKQHRIRRISAEQLHAILQQPALPVAAGVAEAVSEHVLLLVPRLELLQQQRRQTRQRLEALLTQLNSQEPTHAEVQQPEDQTQQVPPSDASVLRSMPGVGVLICATILSEATDAISQRSYEALRAYAGIAPVTKRSGKSHLVQMRYGCNDRLRNALHHMAAGAMQRDEFWRGVYQQLRKRGHSHARALRTLADRLLKRLMAMLNSGTLYDKELASRRASSLALAQQGAATT